MSSDTGQAPAGCPTGHASRSVQGIGTRDTAAKQGEHQGVLQNTSKDQHRYFLIDMPLSIKFCISYMLLSHCILQMIHIMRKIYIFISYNNKYNTYKMKRENYFTLDTTVILLYSILYYSEHDSSIMKHHVRTCCRPLPGKP